MVFVKILEPQIEIIHKTKSRRLIQMYKIRIL